MFHRPTATSVPRAATVELIVIHAISLPPGEFGGAGIVELFTNRLDPAAHPYYATARGPEGVRPLSDPPRRRAHPVRAVRAARAGTPANRAGGAAPAATISRSASSSKARTTRRSTDAAVRGARRRSRARCRRATRSRTSSATATSRRGARPIPGRISTGALPRGFGRVLIADGNRARMSEFSRGVGNSALPGVVPPAGMLPSSTKISRRNFRPFRCHGCPNTVLCHAPTAGVLAGQHSGRETDTECNQDLGNLARILLSVSAGRKGFVECGSLFLRDRYARITSPPKKAASWLPFLFVPGESNEVCRAHSRAGSDTCCGRVSL